MVRFTTVEAAIACLEAMKGREISICGRPVRLEYSNSPVTSERNREAIKPNPTLFLFPVHKDAQAGDIANTLRKYGPPPMDIRMSKGHSLQITLSEQ